MRALILGAAGAAFCFLAACQPNSDKTNPAVATPAAKADAAQTAPAAGANSFTMDQAKERIVNAGYTSVTDLTQDANGVWHGKAMKGGAAATVMVDYQGNVTAQ